MYVTYWMDLCLQKRLPTLYNNIKITTGSLFQFPHPHQMLDVQYFSLQKLQNHLKMSSIILSCLFLIFFLVYHNFQNLLFSCFFSQPSPDLYYHVKVPPPNPHFLIFQISDLTTISWMNRKFVIYKHACAHMPIQATSVNLLLIYKILHLQFTLDMRQSTQKSTILCFWH